MTLCQQILDRWPLRSMCARLGLELPERDNVKFRHPLRPDQNPSCTVHGEKLIDWSREPRTLDAIGLYAMAKGLDQREAIRELARELPGASARDAQAGRPNIRRADRAAEPRGLAVTQPAQPPFTELETPTEAELAALARQRTISRHALGIAARLGHLFFAETLEGRCFVVTDATRQLFQSRRLDGAPWRFIGAKAWTSVAAHGLAGWPLGAQEIGERRSVLLCEGGPDWLVAQEAEPEMAVCTMLGASQSIHPEALPCFAGRTVRILAHADEAGAAAARRWAARLLEVGTSVSAVRLCFDDARDLNDCTRLSLERLRHHQLPQLLCP